MYPREDGEWDPHASYHLDGTLHQKSHGNKVMIVKRQPLTATFKGTEHLGIYCGHAEEGLGAECVPAAFTEVFKVAPGVLESNRGAVGIDLVADGSEPEPRFYETWQIVARQRFSRVGQPAVVITILK
jgi:hypothetical protein